MNCMPPEYYFDRNEQMKWEGLAQWRYSEYSSIDESNQNAEELWNSQSCGDY